jgi:hypothetical protein
LSVNHLATALHSTCPQGYILYSLRKKLKAELVGRSQEEIKELRLAGQEVTDTYQVMQQFVLLHCWQRRLSSVVLHQQLASGVKQTCNKRAAAETNYHLANPAFCTYGMVALGLLSRGEVPGFVDQEPTASG